MNCSVCLERLDILISPCIKTKCGHYFHWHCMAQWFMIRNECALCRCVLGIHDCTSIEGMCITKPSGIIMNEKTFFPKTIHDFSYVLVYLFFLQHSILIDMASSTRLSSSVSCITRRIVECVCIENKMEFSEEFINFHRNKTLKLDIIIKHNYVNSHDNVKFQKYPTIHTDDIKTIFYNHSISNFLLPV